MAFDGNDRLIKVMGGLGNQLFQFAFGQSMQSAGYRVFYDTSWYDECDDHTGYELGPLIADHMTLRGESLKEWRAFEKRKKLLKRLRLDRSWTPAYKEREPEFQEQVYQSDSLRYEGYWQSWKYLERCPAEQLQRIRHFIRDKADASRLPAAIEADNTVVLHIRRGDYFSNPQAAATHAVSLESYYRRAIERLCGDEAAYQFIVYSDDPDPLAHFPSIQLTNVELCSSALSDPYTDLLAMSCAKNLVIANSTYSWWSAYLASPSAKICAPNRWFKTKDVDLTSLFPPNWSVISTDSEPSGTGA